MFMLTLLLGVLSSVPIPSDAWTAFVAAEERAEAEPDRAGSWLDLGDALMGVADAGEFGAPSMWWADARKAYEQALAIDPLNGDVLWALFDTHLLLGDDAQVVSLGERLVGAGQIRDGDAPAEVIAEVLRARSRLLLPRMAEDLAAHEAELADLAQRLDGARRMAPRAPVLVLARADVLADLGQRDLAGDVLMSGLSLVPDSIDLHGQLIDRFVADGRLAHVVAAYDALAGEHPEQALVWWYGGSVQVLLAEQALRERRFDETRASVGRALRWFERCRQLEPAYAEAVRRSRARASAALGWCALGEHDLEQSLADFLDVLAADPELRSEPDGLGRSVMDGLGVLGTRHDRTATYAEGVEVCRAVLAVQPDDGEWWNNLAYFLRQRGAQEAAGFLEVEGDPEQVSQQTFRESWESYLRAVELAPEDVRILNDCALMQVYHLQDEIEGAEQMLHRAIATGHEQLESLGPRAPEGDRFPVAQAMGDAWENLGYAAYHLRDDPDLARHCFEQSIATDSGYRPSVEQFLLALGDEGEPIEQQSAASDARPINERQGERATPLWAWDFEQAVDQSGSEGRACVVYQRGEGLSLIVPWIDELVVRPEVADRLTDVVSLLSDSQRHAPVDRTTTGEIVPCPRFGGPPCGVHVAHATAFRNRWREEHDGADPGESEEGVHWIGSELETSTDVPAEWGDALVAEQGDDRWEMIVADPLDDSGLQQLLDDLMGEDRGASAGAARALLADAVAGGRLSAERRLFDAHAHESVRRHLVEELARRDELDLLATLCGRDDDPVLASLAIDAWPAGEDPAPVIGALLFAPTPTVRFRAAQNLWRVDPSPRTRQLFMARQLLGSQDDQVIAAEALGRARSSDGGSSG